MTIWLVVNFDMCRRRNVLRGVGGVPLPPILLLVSVGIFRFQFHPELVQMLWNLPPISLRCRKTLHQSQQLWIYYSEKIGGQGGLHIYIIWYIWHEPPSIYSRHKIKLTHSKRHCNILKLLFTVIFLSYHKYFFTTSNYVN